MVYSNEQKPKRGQEFRDRVRCEALDNLGPYRTYTLDDKHAEDERTQGDRHCTANFADTHRMLKSMKFRWGEDVSFDMIILDYFFSPAGWAKVRWSENFFKNTLVRIAEENILSLGGSLWLPNVGHVDEMLSKFQSLLAPYYDWHTVTKAENNPLFAATNNVTAELRRCPDNMTNATQVRPLGDEPFYEFKRKPIARAVSTMSPRAESKKATVKAEKRNTKSLTKVTMSVQENKKTRVVPKRSSTRVLLNVSRK